MASKVKQSISMYRDDLHTLRKIKLERQSNGERVFLPDIIHEALLLLQKHNRKSKTA